MKLILIRHGIAEDVSESGSDEDRNLTEDGQKKFKKVAAGILKCERKIDKVISSPLLRAIQTAEIFLTKLHSEKAKPEEPTLSIRIKAADSLVPEKLSILRPNANPHEFCQWLKSNYKTEMIETLVVVGHEPHLSALCSLLLTGRNENFFEFRRGGAACLELYIRPNDIRGNLDWFLKPSQLRRLS
jgi:phosphohistidine phosphatase